MGCEGVWIRGNISAWKWHVTDYNTLNSGGGWSTTGSARGLVVEAAAWFCTSGTFAMSHSMAVGWGPLEMKLPTMLRGRPSDPDTSTRALQPVGLCKPQSQTGELGSALPAGAQSEDTCRQQLGPR